MQIEFSPVRMDATLTLERQGDTLIVNGEAFGFAALAEGDSLPPEEIGSPWFTGPVTRIGGVLHVTLLLPHGAGAPDARRFPQPVRAEGDGPVPLPGGG